MSSIDEFIKVDLHIHSEASKIKSGDEVIVEGMNKDNLDTLLERLENNQINVFSITDHNIFDFDLYNEIKNKIDLENYEHIKKVLPAVEFDMEFDPELYSTISDHDIDSINEDDDNKIHVIAIFNDNNQDELKKLSMNLDGIYAKKLEKIHQQNQDNGLTVPKKNINVVFSETDLSDFFKTIQVNFLLIAHQKGPYQNKNKTTENDFTNLNKDIKEKLLLIKFFDALEFKQLRSNISLKSYLKTQPINFISGSDCHNWNFYPMNTEKELNANTQMMSENNIKRFEFTYLKSDSSFEGLKIALTGDADSRIYLYEPNVDDRVYLNSLDVKLSDSQIKIPLSYGINAVIGNNTSGKTLLLNTAFAELDPDLGDGKDFSSKYEFWPQKANLSELSHKFIHQGEIVEKFAKDKELEEEFQGKFLNIDYSKFDEIINISASKMLDRIKYNTDVYNSTNDLGVDITLPSKELRPYQLIITSSPTAILPKNTRLIGRLKTIIDKIFEIYPDVKTLFYSEFRGILITFISIYEDYIQKIILDYKSKAVVDAFKQSILDYNNLTIEGESQYSDTSKFKNINDLTLKIYDNFISLLKLKKIKIDQPIPNDLSYKPNDSINIEGDFKFIKSSNITLNEEVLKDILTSPFRGKIGLEDILSMTVKQAINSLVENSTDVVNAAALNERYKALLDQRISNNFRSVQLSIVDNEKGLKNQSPGKNAITYLKLKYISNYENIYVIDQPEDQIGPTDIKEKLKPILRKLASKSQVIIITHNPYLVVNLDVDNVIHLDNTSGKMNVHYGALYHKKNGNIIDLIANSLEGGYEAIKERIDRYERNKHK